VSRASATRAPKHSPRQPSAASTRGREPQALCCGGARRGQPARELPAPPPTYTDGATHRSSSPRPCPRQRRRPAHALVPATLQRTHMRRPTARRHSAPPTLAAGPLCCVGRAVGSRPRRRPRRRPHPCMATDRARYSARMLPRRAPGSGAPRPRAAPPAQCGRHAGTFGVNERE